MKKINLLKEIIVVARTEFMKALNSGKRFAIAVDGSLAYEPYDKTLVSIFEGSIPPASPLQAATSRPISAMLGDSYKIVEDDDRILIKATAAWPQIIINNHSRALYDDTTSDGIDKFSDPELESIGWHAVEFGITYRDIIERFEEMCEGTLLCIEQDEPYQFRGLGFVPDLDHARNVAFDYCRSVVLDKLANDPDYLTLSSDEEEAAEFFKAKRP
ncbi:MAG: hypothetical protein AB7S65_04685 [Sulfuricurvum sp.]